MGDYNKFNEYLKNRYRFFLRETTVSGNSKKYYFLRHTLGKQLELNFFLEMIKTLIGFCTYTIFKKGYRFL